MVSASSGATSVATGGVETASGGTPAERKKICAPVHIATAVDAVLNEICRAGIRRRHDTRKLFAAIASVAGPGPNSSAVVMTKVSSIAMFADTAAKLRRSVPVPIVSSTSASQPSGYGVWTTLKAVSHSNTPPTETTNCRYTRSADDETALVRSSLTLARAAAAI